MVVKVNSSVQGKIRSEEIEIKQGEVKEGTLSPTKMHLADGTRKADILPQATSARDEDPGTQEPIQASGREKFQGNGITPPSDIMNPPLVLPAKLLESPVQVVTEDCDSTQDNIETVLPTGAALLGENSQGNETITGSGASATAAAADSVTQVNACVESPGLLSPKRLIFGDQRPLDSSDNRVPSLEDFVRPTVGPKGDHAGPQCEPAQPGDQESVDNSEIVSWKDPVYDEIDRLYLGHEYEIGPGLVIEIPLTESEIKTPSDDSTMPAPSTNQGSSPRRRRSSGHQVSKKRKTHKCSSKRH